MSCNSLWGGLRAETGAFVYRGDRGNCILVDAGFHLRLIVFARLAVRVERAGILSEVQTILPVGHLIAESLPDLRWIKRNSGHLARPGLFQNIFAASPSESGTIKRSETSTGLAGSTATKTSFIFPRIRICNLLSLWVCPGGERRE